MANDERDKSLELDETASMGPSPTVPGTPRARARPAGPRGDGRVGRFELGEVLGEGGMGTVYRAYDPDLDRTLAIKVLRTDRFAGPAASEARERLLREARAMAKLAHANVLTVYEVGVDGDTVFIAMELASGGSLREWMSDGPHPWPEVIGKLVAAGRGLERAHREGLIHRDFKPDNVLITDDGELRVADFGLVGSPSLDGTIGEQAVASTLTQTGAVLGTPAYMAPEQFEGKPAGESADQFAFCASLYEALYAKRPFAGTTVAELATNVCDGIIVPPPADTDVPAAIHRLVCRGLSVAPTDRHASMTALLDALESVERPARQARRGWLVIGAGALVIAAVATAAVVGTRGGGGGDSGGEAAKNTARAAVERDAAPPAEAAPGASTGSVQTGVHGRIAVLHRPSGATADVRADIAQRIDRAFTSAHDDMLSIEQSAELLDTAGIDPLCYEGPCLRGAHERDIDFVLAVTVQSSDAGYQYAITATDLATGQVEAQLVDRCPTCDADMLEQVLTLSMMGMLAP